MSTNKPVLMKTKNYAMFDEHENNRPLHNDVVLLRSMQKHGFMPSSPIQCVRNGKGKLKVIRGHHRLDIAKRLGLVVYYIIDDSVTSIFDLEGGRSLWNVTDYAAARAKAGDEDCAFLLKFMEKHNLSVGSAASLISGQQSTAKRDMGSDGSKTKLIKTGEFHKGDMTHAIRVVQVTDLCREKNIKFATASAFVRAISMCIRVPEFDIAAFLHKIDTNHASLRKRGTTEEYLEEIEAFYNYGVLQKKRMPLAFRAKEER